MRKEPAPKEEVFNQRSGVETLNNLIRIFGEEFPAKKPSADNESEQEALNLSMKSVLKFVSNEVGINTSFKKKKSGEWKIIEDGTTTHCLVGKKDNLVYSFKRNYERINNHILLAELYLNKIGDKSMTREEIAKYLLKNCTYETSEEPKCLTEKEKENKKFLKELEKKWSLPIRKAGHISENEVKTPEYLVEDIIPEGGISMLLAHPQMYKSWISMHIISSLINGEKVFGKFKVKPKKCLIINVDDHQGTTLNRLEKMGVRNHDNLYIWTDNEIDIMSEGLTEMIRNFIDENGIGFIVIDTLRKVHDVDENNSEDVNRLFNKFRDLIKAKKTSILLVHHKRKSPSSHSGNTLRGSSAMLGELVSLLTLTKSRREDSVALKQDKNKIGKQIEPLTLKFKCELEPWAFEIEEGISQGIKKEEVKKKITSLFGNDKSFPDDQIFKDENKINKNKTAELLSNRNGIPKAKTKEVFNEMIENETLVEEDQAREYNRKYYYLNQS